MRLARTALVAVALGGFPALASGAASGNPSFAPTPSRAARPIAAAFAMSRPQGPEAAAAASQGAERQGPGGKQPTAVERAREDIITPHITDAHALDYPYWKPPFVREAELPRWAPVRIGPVTLDLSPTKHVVMLFVAALLCAATLIGAAISHKRHHLEVGRPKGFAAGIEAMVLLLRDEVILPNVGHGGERYVPFCLTLFFFILFANLLGLLPYMSTATGNISVTATLAVISFIMIEVAGMRALGPAYLGTIVYWPHDMSIWIKVPMTIIMTPIEIVGKFTKPFALAIRLFANMTAGHIVVLALIGLVFAFHSYLVAGGPIIMAVLIMMLELFVAFLQAFIFCLLTATFIGQIRESHH